MTRRAITLFALVCALVLGAPAVAGAASGDTAPAAISDCNAHGQLTAHYASDTLRTALAQMPVDVREYTDCYDVIERQLFAQLGQAKPGAVTGTPAASSSGSGLPAWLLVVIVLLALGGVTFGALAIRRRSAVAEGPDAGAPGGGPAGPSGPGAPGGADDPARPPARDEDPGSGPDGPSAGA